MGVLDISELRTVRRQRAEWMEKRAAILERAEERSREVLARIAAETEERRARNHLEVKAAYRRYLKAG